MKHLWAIGDRYTMQTLIKNEMPETYKTPVAEEPSATVGTVVTAETLQQQQDASNSGEHKKS
jgi:hypothetical protein